MRKQNQIKMYPMFQHWVAAELLQSLLTAILKPPIRIFITTKNKHIPEFSFFDRLHAPHQYKKQPYFLRTAHLQLVIKNAT